MNEAQPPIVVVHSNTNMFSSSGKHLVVAVAEHRGFQQFVGKPRETFIGFIRFSRSPHFDCCVFVPC